MNRKDFLAKYDGHDFHFVEYHKFQFKYQAVIDGKNVTVWLGDYKERDIYRNYFKAVQRINEFTLLDWKVEKIV